MKYRISQIQFTIYCFLHKKSNKLFIITPGTLSFGLRSTL